MLSAVGLKPKLLDALGLKTQRFLSKNHLTP